MLATDAVDWSAADFLAAGALLFAAGSALVLVVGHAPRGWRAPLGVAITVSALWLWAELAVGVITDLGS